MSIKSGFTPEEWTLIVEAPTSVATLVAMASFDMGDMIKEFGTLETRSAALAQEIPGNALISEIAAELKARSDARQAQAAAQPAAQGASPTNQPSGTTIHFGKGESAEAARKELLPRLAQAVAALNAKAAPQEAAQYRQWLYTLAEEVAGAAKEGDFLGIGGKRINEAESTMLAEIKALLAL